MRASGVALGAAVLALAAVGCGSKEPPPFKEVKQPASSAAATTPAPPEPSSDGALAKLGARQQRALAALVQAQAALTARADALASATSDADKVVQRIASGYAAPSGSSSPEVRRLADALAGFGTTLAPIARRTDLLPQLSAQLKQRYRQLVKSRPRMAARLLEAKQEVDGVLAALPHLGQAVATAAATANQQAAEATLDAEELNAAITGGAAGATSALNGVHQAVEAGIRALAAA